MKFNKVSEDVFITDFGRTFKNTDMTNPEIIEGVKAIYKLITLPIYKEEENTYIIEAPFGIQLLPDETIIVPIGLETDDDCFRVESINKKIEVSSVTQTGHIFVMIHNKSKKLFNLEPDQAFAQITDSNVQMELKL